MRFASPLAPLHRIAFLEGRSWLPRAQSSRPGAGTGVPHVEGANAAPEYLAFGPLDEEGERTCEVVAEFEGVEVEYATIRRGCALFDEPWRGTLEVTGKDRIEFLNRLVTQDLRTIDRGGVTRGFLTNRKGRIDADLLLVETGSNTIIDLVIHDAASVASIMQRFVFAESVSIEDCSARMHALSVHGPLAETALASVGLSVPEGATVLASDLYGGTIVFKHDCLGEPGFSIRVAWNCAGALWNDLRAHEAVRCGGWGAYNIARIERGEPIFHIDFGPNNLPHETGVLASRVSFTKGCYPGQEVVARMHHLGKPKQMLVGIRLQGDALPSGDAFVHEVVADGATGRQIGTVTSSCVAPMLGAAAVAFAMIRSESIALGTVVQVKMEWESAIGEVHALRFFGGGNP